jgi:hypothetical protein
MKIYNYAIKLIYRPINNKRKMDDSKQNLCTDLDKFRQNVQIIIHNKQSEYT